MKILKKLLNFSFKISKKYAVDISCFNKIRNFKDGISFFDANINLDLYEGDHNPKFSIRFLILNVMIIELDIYNVNHIKEL